MKIALMAPLVLLVGLTAGCGGDDSSDQADEPSSTAPTSATATPSESESPSSAPTETPTPPEPTGDPQSVTEFCTSYAATEQDSDFETIKQWLVDTADRGLPQEVPAKAQSGFEVLYGVAAESADEAEAEARGKQVDDEGENRIDAFFRWAEKNCGESDSP